MTEKQMPADEFQDPLGKYETPQFDDPIERALHNERVERIQAKPFTTVDRDLSVREVVSLMHHKNIACVMIEDQGELVGIFSDRDIMNKVALEWDEMNSQPVSTVMNPNPVFVRESSSAAAALSVVAVSGYRHVPVLGDDNRIAGMITPQRINRFLRECVGE